jgi:hypothetical protein
MFLLFKLNFSKVRFYETTFEIFWPGFWNFLLESRTIFFLILLSISSTKYFSFSLLFVSFGITAEKVGLRQAP